MQATEGRIGRVFMLRLEDGDLLPDCIERFAWEKKVSSGHAVFVGGAGGGQVVVGPRESSTESPNPMLLPIDGAHEMLGVGVLASDGDGRPILHMHAALGRSGHTLTGCVRPGVVTWLVGEVILYEILDARAMRLPDPKSGFTLLEVGDALDPGRDVGGPRVA